MYKKDEAKAKILGLFPAWAKENGFDLKNPIDGTDAMYFYQYVAMHHKELLNFRSNGGDKWQEVHAWLNRARYSK